MKKTVLSYLLLVCLVVSSFTACTGSAATLPSEPTPAEADAAAAPNADADLAGVELIFWNVFTGSDGSVLTDLVNRFNEKNEYGIKVKMDIIPGPTFQQKVPQAIATGTAPDFVINNAFQMGRYLDAGSYKPLNEYLEVGARSRDDFEPAALDLYLIDGQQWQMPINLYGRLYYYWNKDLFRKAGLDPEKPAQTWDEVLEIAAKTTDVDNGVYGLGIPVQEQNPLPLSMMMAEGGIWFDEATNTSNLTKPEVRDVLKKLQTAIKDHQISPPNLPGGQMDSVALAGQLAQFFNGPWMVNGFRENNIDFGIAVLPANAAGERSGTLEGGGFAILRDTTELKTRAVYKFLDFFYSDEIFSEWCLRTGFPPMIKSVAALPEVQADPVLSVTMDAFEYVEPHFSGYSTMPQIYEDVINPLCEGVFYGGLDVDEETTKMDAKLNEILATE